MTATARHEFTARLCRRRTMTRTAVSNGCSSVRKRAEPRNRMREILTSGSVGGLAEQSPILPGRGRSMPRGHLPWATMWNAFGVK